MSEAAVESIIILEKLALHHICRQMVQILLLRGRRARLHTDDEHSFHM